MTNSTASRTVEMGRVRGVHGVRGLIKVESYCDPMEALLNYEPWRLQAPEASPSGKTTQEFVVESGQRHGPGLLIKLVGCTTREQAQALVGCTIEVPYADLPPPGPDAYYWVDLQGLEVMTVNGICLGRVAYLFETGANDVMAVVGDRERMVPYIDDVVRSIDLDKGTIVVDWDPDF